MSTITKPSPKRESTDFAEALIVTPTNNDNTIFSGSIPWDYCGVSSIAHGGFLTSLLLSAARTYFTFSHLALNQPDPINSHVQLLRPVLAGPVTLSVKPLKLGKRVSIIQISLQQSPLLPSNTKKGIFAAKDDFKTCVIAIITQSNLSTEKGLTLNTTPTFPKEKLPDRETDCEEYKLHELAYKLAPVTTKFEGFKLKGGKDGMLCDKDGLSIREIWIKRCDGFGFDTLSLGQLVDSFQATPANFSPHNTDIPGQVSYPTLSIATEIKKDPKSCTWLFLRIRAHVIKNGRFDTDLWVIDEGGELVAMSKHVSLVNVPKGMGEGEVSRVFKL